MAAACLGFAALSAARKGQPNRHKLAWAVLALVFVALIVLRLWEVEDTVRDSLREAAREAASYEGRRDYQRPIAAAILMGLGISGSAFLYKASKGLRGRRQVALAFGIASGILMLVLICLRIISLHSVDLLLYGAMKLNWVGDIGLTLLASASALYYVRALYSPRKVRVRPQ